VSIYCLSDSLMLNGEYTRSAHTYTTDIILTL